MVVFSYMPMPLEAFEERSGICMTLCAMLPVDVTHPNGTTGSWASCFREPATVRLTNAFLWLMAVADAAMVTVYIETIPDYKLLRDGGVAVARFYRLLIPLTEADTRAIIMHMANMLSDETEPKQDRASKRQRSGSNSGSDKHVFTERSASGEAIDTHPLSNIKLDYRLMNSEKAFLQYFATATGGILPYVSEIDFTCPPAAINNGVDSDSDASDSDDDADMQSIEQFTQWFELLPNNNILKLLSIDVHFDTGTKAHPGIHEDQRNPSNYVGPNGTFTFPTVCIDRELVLEIRHTAPFMCKSPNTLIGNFLLPGATLWSMTAEELLTKIEKCAQIRGDKVPSEYYDMSFDELRRTWRNASTCGQDVTYFDPIDMDPVENRASVLTTDSDRLLAQIYPEMGHMKHRLSDVEFQRMKKVLDDGDITEETMASWRSDTIRKILAFWAGQPQEGFVRAYFAIRVESMAIAARLRRQKDAVTTDARRYRCMKTVEGMDATNSRIALSADLLRGALHLTPPQAATCFLMFITSHTTYKPEIGGMQITIVLCGGYGTGKSHSIECAHNMLPSSSRVSLDMASKKAITANKTLGVVKVDEFKIGVRGGVEEINHLTAMATGTCHYNRFLLNTNDGQKSENILIVSDQRETIYTASNSPLEPRVEARVIAITHSGITIDGTPGSEEHATLSNTNADVQAALLFFQSVFASHTQLHLVQQLLRFTVEKSYFPLWYGLATAVMGKDFAPQPRQIKSLDSIATGIMMFRLGAEYDARTDSLTEASTFVEYCMANCVVSMFDYTLAYYMLTVNTSKALEESSVLIALKSALQTTEDGEQFATFGGNYFVTNLRTSAEVMVRCKGKMSKASGLVTSVMKSMQSSNGKGAEPSVVVINTRSNQYSGQYAILKSVAAAPNLNDLLPSQCAIFEFLRQDVMNEVAKDEKPTMFSVSFDEEWVVFHRNVHDRLMRPYLAAERFKQAPSLQSARLSQDDIKRGMYLFEAAGIMKFRVPDAHPDDLDGEGTTISTFAAGAKSVPVTAGGPLDPNRIFPDFNSATDANLANDQWRNAQATAMDASRAPPKTLYKAPLIVSNCIMVNIAYLTDALVNVDRVKYGSAPLHVAKDALPCSKLYDAVFAVSGEYKPGDTICLGPDPTSAVTSTTYTVGSFPEEQISVKNPRFRAKSVADAANAATNDGVLEMLLPARQARVTFARYDAGGDSLDLTSRIRNSVAVANGVPTYFCKNQARVVD